MKNKVLHFDKLITRAWKHITRKVLGPNEVHSKLYCARVCVNPVSLRFYSGVYNRPILRREHELHPGNITRGGHSKR